MLDNLTNTTQYHPGQLIVFSGLDGQTDFESGLLGRMSVSHFGIDIMYPGICRIKFSDDKHGKFLIGSDFIDSISDTLCIRAAMIDAYHLLIEGECVTTNETDMISIACSGSKTLIAVKSRMKPELVNENVDAVIENRKQWLRSQRQSVSRSAYTKALSIMKSQVCSPQGSIKHRWTTPDRWPHRGMWLWDSAFHAIGWRHIDPKLAQEMLESVLDVQRDDGMIPHYADPFRKSGITQPPVLALAAKLVNEKLPDHEWIRRIYPRLCGYVKWDLKNRDTDKDGLLEWFIEEHQHCRSGESGMDNSPRFDSATTIDAVDFNSYVAHECEILSQFAEQLGYKDDAVYWRSVYQNLCSLINDRLWNAQTGIYVDYFPMQGRQSEILAGAGFLPLITGSVNSDRVQLLAEHLRNPNTFGVDFPIPTIAACDNRHYSKDMWRGPTWVNLNWLIAYGFRRCGAKEASDFIIRRTIDKLEYYFERYGTFFEFYDDRGQVDPPQLLRKSKNDPSIWSHQVIFDYGWSATLYVDMINSLNTDSASLRKNEPL